MFQERVRGFTIRQAVGERPSRARSKRLVDSGAWLLLAGADEAFAPALERIEPWRRIATVSSSIERAGVGIISCKA